MMMKVRNLFLSLFLGILWLSTCYAQQRGVERIYISTDREAYVAGERIRLSLFCFDLSTSTLGFTELSAVAYVELRHEVTMVSSAKIRINRGRGSGYLEIPFSLPTGNYRLIAYTKQMLNEEKTVCFDKSISIFNTLSTERVPQNVFIKSEDLAEEIDTFSSIDSKHVDVTWGMHQNSVKKNQSLPVSVTNKSGEVITLSISVVRADLPIKQDYSLQAFITQNRSAPAGVVFQQRYVPEYEGEIIRGRVTHTERLPAGDTLFLSAVGSGVEVYASPVDSVTGEFAFFTNSLYGNREIVLEYPAVKEASFELFDPFVKPPVKPVSPLYLDQKYEPYLTQRSVEMQLSRRFGIDTLLNITTMPADPFLYNKPIVYDLDHYTRFPLMQDIMIEFISEMRFRRINNQLNLQIMLETGFGPNFTNGPLIVIDGIAIFDHERLLTYDPSPVKSVSIYQNVYGIGRKIFNGIAKFDTFTGKYPGLMLGKNAIILDYQGVHYPSRFTGKAIVSNDNLPDIRSLLYWDPQVDMMVGDQKEIVVNTSSVPGKYVMVMEGITANGQAVYYRSTFTVE